jgi:hypothetical protein
MKTIRKEYQRPFILEPSKLSRILDVAHDNLSSATQGQIADSFEISMAGNRTEQATVLDDVLNLDNSRRYKILRVLITSSASSSNSMSHLVEIDFDGHDGSKPKTVLTVRSDATGWASRTFSELEEQVERTRSEDLGQRGAVAGLLIVFLISLLGFLLSISPHVRQDPLSLWGFTSEDGEYLRGLLESNETLTAEQLRELRTRQYRNLINAVYPSKPNFWLNGRTIFASVSVVVLGTSAVILLASCYPGAVFLWGDGAERYQRLKQRR